MQHVTGSVMQHVTGRGSFTPQVIRTRKDGVDFEGGDDRKFKVPLAVQLFPSP
jgi:hypothetical protein